MLFMIRLAFMYSTITVHCLVTFKFETSLFILYIYVYLLICLVMLQPKAQVMSGRMIKTSFLIWILSIYLFLEALSTA